MIFKFKYVLFILIFISNFSCLKQSSKIFNSNSNSNTYYFLSHRGQDEGGDVLASSTVPFIERFFTEKYSMFKMNYIKSNTYESSTLAKIQNDITKVSKQLDSESSLVWLYHAHGKEDGTFIAGETVNTDHIIEALKKGRTNDDGSVKPPFKRLVILAFSCFSNQFIFQFQKALEKLETPLFEEGIYLASSDSTRVTLLEYSFEMFAPILMLLRDQQFVGCKIRNRDYSKSYEVINNDFFRNQFSLKNLNLYLDQISKDKKITQEEALKMIIEHESFNKKNPTFNDLVPILNKLREYEQNAISFDMNISFTDGKNKKESSTSSIFPPIENCN